MMNDNIYEKNRKAWNEAVRYHKIGRKYNLVDLINQGLVLDSIEDKMLKSNNLYNKSICQLCCNNGRELIAIKNKYDTRRTVGFDFSDEAIKEANELKNYFDCDVEFYRCNVFDIDKKFFNNFDYIYITVGTLNWIENLKDFFSLVYNLLDNNGILMIYELHPITRIFPALNSKEYLNGKSKEILYDYFDESIDKYYDGLDYIGKKRYNSVEIIEYNHTLSNVINSIIQSQLRIVEFNEYKNDISSVYEHLQELEKLPLSYSIIAKK